MPGAPFDREFRLPVNGEWVQLEEEFLWVPSNRNLFVGDITMVPDAGGITVQLRHNFQWPSFHWEVVLQTGVHQFHAPWGYNRFIARLVSGSSGDVWVNWKDVNVHHSGGPRR